MMVGKMIFLLNWMVFRFHVNLPGCNGMIFFVYFFIYEPFFSGNKFIILDKTNITISFLFKETS